MCLLRTVSNVSEGRGSSDSQFLLLKYKEKIMSGLAFRGEGEFVNIKIKNPNYATFDRQEKEQFENARMFKLYVTNM